MPIIVETGSGVLNANSYVSLTEADDYFAIHAFYSDAWSDLDVTKRTALLQAATTQLDVMFTWFGYQRFNEQSLAWPRTHVPNSVGGYFSESLIPIRLKQATYEMAFFLSRGDPFGPSSAAGVERLKIDVIELQFTSSTTINPVPAAALILLKGLGEYAFGSRVRKVLVG